MKRSAALSLWALATVVLAAGTSLVVLHWNRGGEEAGLDFHDWVHAHLDLSAEQHRRLLPAEQRFDGQQSVIRAQIAAASRALAVAIQSGGKDSPQITAALDDLHNAQAELQRATLNHFFDMKEQLDPEQVEKLRRWTHERLLHP
jgi:Spy/CpxP family protein refolding chaperone